MATAKKAPVKKLAPPFAKKGAPAKKTDDKKLPFFMTKKGGK